MEGEASDIPLHFCEAQYTVSIVLLQKNCAKAANCPPNKFAAVKLAKYKQTKHLESSLLKFYFIVDITYLGTKCPIQMMIIPGYRFLSGKENTFVRKTSKCVLNRCTSKNLSDKNYKGF